jgi:urocanate hydratase
MVIPEAQRSAGHPPAEAGAAPLPPNNDPPAQTQVYRAYLHLESLAAQHLDGSLAGKLVLSVGFGLQGAELALASTIACAAFLGLESDPRRLKTAVRNGSCNFMVNTLDEALRVLKNEIRKRQPVSVGLLGAAGDLLSAMVERGVQPDLLCDTTFLRAPENDNAPPSVHRQALLRLAERGAAILNPASSQPSETLELTWTAATPQDMQRMDRLALDVFSAEDKLHRRWLHGAASAFHRQRPLQRVVGVEPPQQQQILDAFARSDQAAPFTAPAALRSQHRDGSAEELAWKSRSTRD